MPSLFSKAVAGSLLVCALLASARTLADTAASPSTEPGIWQKHKYSFVFMGFTSTYSCDGLADKLRLLLIASGARSDAKTTAGACASGFGRPDKIARAELTFYTLAPPDPAKPAAGPIVNGMWQSVTFADRTPRDLSTGDCELVEQFKSNVLPMFTTRNIQNKMTCIPHQLSGSQIDLTFESFVVAPHNTAPLKK